MAARGGEISTVAERYASALFDLTRAQNTVADAEQALDRFHGWLRETPDLRRAVLSPVFSSSEQQAALTALFAKAGITGLVHDFLLLLAKNRRLFAVEKVIESYKSLVSKERGEIDASVVSAIPLTTAQRDGLCDTLRQKLGKTPRLTASVDPALLGGLVVKIGSQMIDTSLRTKLKTLELAMKEAG